MHYSELVGDMGASLYVHVYAIKVSVVYVDAMDV